MAPAIPCCPAGGNGGYLKTNINVSPGTTYSISIGVGGFGGIAIPNSSINNNYTANSGSSGGNTSFDTIFSPGGVGGQGGFTGASTISPCANNGVSGSNGLIINYSPLLISYSINSISSDRPYIPVGYAQTTLVPDPSAGGGIGGSAGLTEVGTSLPNVNAANGSNGVNGYCVISY